MLFGHPYVSFCETSIQIFSPSLTRLFILLLSCKTYLHILDTSTLSDMCFVNVFFPQSLACLPFFSTVSFEDFYILIKSSLLAFFLMGTDFCVHWRNYCLSQSHELSSYLRNFGASVL